MLFYNNNPVTTSIVIPTKSSQSENIISHKFYQVDS